MESEPFDPKPWAMSAATCKWKVNTMFHAHPSFPCSKYCFQLDVWHSMPPDAEFGLFHCLTEPKKPAEERDPLTNRLLNPNAESRHEREWRRWDDKRQRRLAERDRRVNLILAEIARTE